MLTHDIVHALDFVEYISFLIIAVPTQRMNVYTFQNKGLEGTDLCWGKSNFRQNQYYCRGQCFLRDN